jgi:hypothetical protein
MGRIGNFFHKVGRGIKKAANWAWEHKGEIAAGLGTVGAIAGLGHEGYNQYKNLGRALSMLSRGVPGGGGGPAAPAHAPAPPQPGPLPGPAPAPLPQLPGPVHVPRQLQRGKIY